MALLYRAAPDRVKKAARGAFESVILSYYLADEKPGSPVGQAGIPGEGGVTYNITVNIFEGVGRGVVDTKMLEQFKKDLDEAMKIVNNLVESAVAKADSYQAKISLRNQKARLEEILLNIKTYINELKLAALRAAAEKE